MRTKLKKISKKRKRNTRQRRSVEVKEVRNISCTIRQSKSAGLPVTNLMGKFIR